MTVVQLSIRLLLFILAGFIARKVKAMPDGFDRMQIGRASCRERVLIPV